MELACFGKIIHNNKRIYVLESTFHGKSVNLSLILNFKFV